MANGGQRDGMGLRPDVVRQRLAKLEEVVSHLLELETGDASRLSEDFRLAWAVERGLHLGSETIFDLGNHILTAHFGIAPRDYEEIAVRLAEVGVIDAALRDRLKGLGGFRNLLVHEYMRLDPDRIAEHLRRDPADFTEVAQQIRTWLDQYDEGTSG